MPLIEARLLEGVFSSDERERLAEGLIDAVVGVKGESFPPSEHRSTRPCRGCDRSSTSGSGRPANTAVSTFGRTKARCANSGSRILPLRSPRPTGSKASPGSRSSRWSRCFGPNGVSHPLDTLGEPGCGRQRRTRGCGGAAPASTPISASSRRRSTDPPDMERLAPMAERNGLEIPGPPGSPPGQ
jgi:hypothetical protein